MDGGEGGERGGGDRVMNRQTEEVDKPNRKGRERWKTKRRTKKPGVDGVG